MSNPSPERAKEILSSIKYLTVASITPEGLPWNSPVFGGPDESYNLYFGTHKNSQKARNITVNNSVFVVIYDSTTPPGTGEGVYIQGHAEVVTEPKKIEKIYRSLKKRHDDHFWKLAALGEGGPINIYRVVPETTWMNSSSRENGCHIDIRVEIDL